MPTTQNNLREVFDRALQAPRGIRVKCLNYPAAVQLRKRLHGWRVGERRESVGIYPEGDPRRGRSPYDNLVCSIVHAGTDRVWTKDESGAGADVLIRPGQLPMIEEILEETA